MIAARTLARGPAASSSRLRHLLAAPAAQQSASLQFHSTTHAAAAASRRQRVPNPSTNATRPAATSQGAASSRQRVDAHQMADDRIRASPDTRIPGTEAIASLTPQQKMRNFATAAGLICFVTGVWWYSIQAVGRAEVDELGLRAEAEEARGAAERRSMEKKEAEELAELEVTMANLAQSEGGDEIMEAAGSDITVAVAAPDDIAREEEERNLAARKGQADGDGAGGRPLWKKIVFFWRKE